MLWHPPDALKSDLRFKGRHKTTIRHFAGNHRTSMHSFDHDSSASDKMNTVHTHVPADGGVRLYVMFAKLVTSTRTVRYASKAPAGSVVAVLLYVPPRGTVSASHESPPTPVYAAPPQLIRGTVVAGTSAIMAAIANTPICTPLLICAHDQCTRAWP